MENTKRANRRENQKGSAVMLLTIAIAAMMSLSACERYNVKSQGGASSPGSGSEEKVRLDLYVMSQCPYGVQAENLLEEVFDKIGGSVDFKLEFIGSGSASNLNSLHGENEVKGNIAQLCAIKYNPSEYFDMVMCMNEDPGSIPDNWESCAAETGIDVENVKSCYEGDEGKKLAEESFKRSDLAGAQGSPTFKINGKEYTGRRDAKGILAGLCKAFEKDAPKECDDLPKPVEFEILIVNDKECKECDTSNIEAGLSQIFDGAKFRTLDASDNEGKEAISKYGLTMAPSFIFDAKVEETEEWKGAAQLQQAFIEQEGKWVLRDEATGASWHLDPAKRAEVLKAAAEAKAKALNTLGVDGDDKPQVDFFVMSYCPFGNQAEETIKEVWDQLKDKAEFNPHYVIYKNYQGGSAQFCLGEYCSMHGIQELNQNIREMCVRKLWGMKEWFDFAIAMNSKCTYQNADTCWTDVAKSLKLDDKKIAACEKDQGLDLVKAEHELNELLGVQGSPTTFVEGEEFVGARTPAGYQAALCDAYTTAPLECQTKLSGEATVSSTGGGCGTAS